MARVSQEHLDARRRQILDGAARCFARNGFHATSMQDVLRESGLSAGAVYRYFSGKEEIITAIAEEVFTTVRGAYAEAVASTPPPPVDVLLPAVLDRVFTHTLGGDDPLIFTRLILQVWSETLRSPELTETLRAGFASLLGLWTELITAYQEAGLMPREAEPTQIARVLIATAQGFIAQQALFGDVDPAAVRAGLAALLPTASRPHPA
ncbi:AcrR family transcriptional regulator [Kitasatospora gansuensis]|uniref:AcrR family transcriptional regulator n=1 Tax=Kitasatospora gansuensis TaxID=258050 RepID=A0A7W7WKZ5_9ACTN|nr:TetR/AcrR family transcriptional regulator [Kitasatospora gansuensis]MBB4951327.1 AcrR family transcriptional regulator [Kitasatospora gansuensis]